MERTKFVIWSQLNNVPTSVLESLVNTSTFSIQLSESVVSIASTLACGGGEGPTINITLERHDELFEARCRPRGAEVVRI